MDVPVRCSASDVERDRWKGPNPNLVVVDHLTYPQSRSQVIKLIGLPVTTVDREGTKRQREERQRERERREKTYPASETYPEDVILAELSCAIPRSPRWP